MTINIGELVSTTLRNREGKIADNIRENNALLTRLNERGGWKATTGGRDIVEPLSYGTNSNTAFYEGYEAFDVQPQDMIDSATYDWKQAATWATFSGLEGIKNRGKAEVLDLLEARIDASLGDLENTIAASLFSDGTGSGGKELGGLQLLIDDDPTSTGSVGGIAQQTYTWWRNYTSGSQTLSASTIQTYMNNLHLDTVRGKEAVDLFLADSTMYGYYWASLQTIQRITQSKMGEAGFTSLAFLGADVVYDVNCPAKRMYGVNTKYLKFRYSPDRKFKVGKEREVTNADYVIIPIWFAGNLTCSNRERQGVIIDD